TRGPARRSSSTPARSSPSPRGRGSRGASEPRSAATRDHDDVAAAVVGPAVVARRPADRLEARAPEEVLELEAVDPADADLLAAELLAALGVDEAEGDRHRLGGPITAGGVRADDPAAVDLEGLLRGLGVVDG